MLDPLQDSHTHLPPMDRLQFPVPLHLTAMQLLVLSLVTEVLLQCPTDIPPFLPLQPQMATTHHLPTVLTGWECQESAQQSNLPVR